MKKPDKKKSAPKLKLGREKVRELSDKDLGTVEGGQNGDYLITGRMPGDPG